MSKTERVTFGSKLGVVLASAGSAVGLGNIWRFPCEVGENGGAAFMLIYLVCVIFLGIPVMASEFLIGRRSRTNVATAYTILAPGTKWPFVGFMGVFAAFLILSYYTVVAGWTLEYSVAAAVNKLSGDVDFVGFFNDFVSNPWKSSLYVVVFMFLTHFIVVRGVTDGIERFSKIMMPLLLLIIVVLVFCSFFMPGTKEGLTFLLKPDFSKLTPETILSAMGQAFFSLSIGMGCLCTYGSYFGKDTNLLKTAGSVAVIDTVVAFMAGFIIFPAVYSISGISPDVGPGLVFVTMPNVFNMIFSGLPWLGYIFSVLFYALLVLAALTSTVSLHEVVTAYIHEKFNLSRKAGAYIVTVMCSVLGVICALSFGVLSGYRLFDMTVFDLFDFFSAKFLMPLGGMLISVFAGWYLDRKIVWDEITNGGSIRFRFFKFYIFLLKFIAPVSICIIFINELFK